MTYNKYQFGCWLSKYNRVQGTNLRPSQAKHLIEQAKAENYGLSEHHKRARQFKARQRG